MSWMVEVAAFFSRILPEKVKAMIYGNKPLAGAIRGSLNASVPEGIQQVQVAAGILAGMPLMLDMKREKDYWLGTYEMDLQTALKELVKPGMVTYDVGANIGYVSLIMARLTGETGKVVAFEALPENVKRWVTNVELNGLMDHTEIFSLAVTQWGTPARFLVHASGGMGKVEGSPGRTDVSMYKETIEVASVSLDQFVYRQGNAAPDLVKMDIEGGEVFALPGMEKIIKEKHPILLLELHGPEATQFAWTYLKDLGYQLCWMKSGFPPVESLEKLGWKAYLVAKPVQV